MSEIDPITLANIRLWYSELDDPDYGRMAHYNLGTRWREVIGFLLTEARRQALEEAAKVAESVTKQEVAGLGLEDPIRNGIRWTGERIKDAIRALASDEVKA